MIIEIKNWEEYNPRKDLKSLTWLRLDAEIGFSDSLFGLSADAKWLWVWLLSFSAKKNKSKLQLNLDYVEHHSSVKKENIPTYIQEFVEKDLIEVKTNTSRIRTDSIENVSYETDETNETDERNERDRPAPTLVSRVWELFNSKIAGNHGIKHTPHMIPPNLIENFKNLCGFKGFMTIEDWDKYFNLVLSSEFLMKKKTPKLTIAWLLDSENAFDILSGKYDDRPEIKPKKEVKLPQHIEINAGVWANEAYEAIRRAMPGAWKGDSDFARRIMARVLESAPIMVSDINFRTELVNRLKNAYFEISAEDILESAS